MSAEDESRDARTLPMAQPVDPLVEHQPHGRIHAAGTEDTMSSTAPAPQPPAPRQDTARTRSDEPAELTGPAVGTLAWGLVVLAVAGVLVVREATDLAVDLSYALPIGMVALGLLLVVGAVVTGVRRR